jgi:hypothetical protein
MDLQELNEKGNGHDRLYRLNLSRLQKKKKKRTLALSIHTFFFLSQFSIFHTSTPEDQDKDCKL